jgi:hypothetical protein
MGWGAYAVAVSGRHPGFGDAVKDAFSCPGLGLASAPAFLLVLAIVPIYGPLFVLAAYMWLLLTTIAAVIPALELDTQSALVAATAGCVVLFAVAQVLPLLVV